MKAKTNGQTTEVERLRQELKSMKRQLAEETLDHRIDTALLEILCEEYHLDVNALKKKSAGTKSPIA